MVLSVESAVQFANWLSKNCIQVRNSWEFEGVITEPRDLFVRFLTEREIARADTIDWFNFIYDENDLLPEFGEMFKHEIKNWKKGGKFHRLDGPAQIDRDGGEAWFLEGKEHRTDGPSYESPCGYFEWKINDEFHREGGPAYHDPSDGEEAWYINGNAHRIGGPAKTSFDGTKEWWVNGMRHREDGPAVIDGLDIVVCEWWLNDHMYETETQYLQELKKIKDFEELLDSM